MAVAAWVWWPLSEVMIGPLLFCVQGGADWSVCVRVLQEYNATLPCGNTCAYDGSVMDRQASVLERPPLALGL